MVIPSSGQVEVGMARVALGQELEALAPVALAPAALAPAALAPAALRPVVLRRAVLRQAVTPPRAALLLRVAMLLRVEEVAMNAVTLLQRIRTRPISMQSPCPLKTSPQA